MAEEDPTLEVDMGEMEQIKQKMMQQFSPQEPPSSGVHEGEAEVGKVAEQVVGNMNAVNRMFVDPTKCVNYTALNQHLCDSDSSEECRTVMEDMNVLTQACTQGTSLNQRDASTVSFRDSWFLSSLCTVEKMRDFHADWTETSDIYRRFGSIWGSGDALELAVRASYYAVKGYPFWWPTENALRPPGLWFKMLDDATWENWCPWMNRNFMLSAVDEAIGKECEERSSWSVIGAYETFKIDGTGIHFPEDSGSSDATGNPDFEWKIWCEGPNGVRTTIAKSDNPWWNVGKGTTIPMSKYGYRECEQGSVIKVELWDNDQEGFILGWTSADYAAKALEPEWYGLLAPGMEIEVPLVLEDPNAGIRALKAVFNGVLELLGGICLTDFLGPIGRVMKAGKVMAKTKNVINKLDKGIQMVDKAKANTDKYKEAMGNLDTVSTLTNDGTGNFLEDMWNMQCIQAQDQPLYYVKLKFADATEQPGYMTYSDCIRNAKSQSWYQEFLHML